MENLFIIGREKVAGSFGVKSDERESVVKNM